MEPAQRQSRDAPRPPSQPSSAKHTRNSASASPSHEINFAATVHCRNSDTDIRVGLFFQAAAKDSPLDSPYNAEPHKCAKIAWYPMTMLPATTMPYSALGISLYQRKAYFGTTGW